MDIVLIQMLIHKGELSERLRVLDQSIQERKSATGLVDKTKKRVRRRRRTRAEMAAVRALEKIAKTQKQEKKTGKQEPNL